MIKILGSSPIVSSSVRLTDYRLSARIPCQNTGDGVRFLDSHFYRDHSDALNMPFSLTENTFR